MPAVRNCRPKVWAAVKLPPKPYQPPLCCMRIIDIQSIESMCVMRKYADLSVQVQQLWGEYREDAVRHGRSTGRVPGVPSFYAEKSDDRSGHYLQRLRLVRHRQPQVVGDDDSRQRG